MAEVTYYVALPFVATDEGIAAGEPTECFNPLAVIMRAVASTRPNPEILKQVVAAGHSVGTHTWSHANLNSKKMNEQQARDEIEKDFSAVKLAMGAAPSPFFSLSASAAWSGGGELPWVAQRRDLLLRR